MQTTYRVPIARAGLVALLAALVLLSLPGTGIAASVSVGSAPILEAGAEPLAPGAGYGVPDDALRVRALQRTLRRLGWRPGPVDGLFGPMTQAAVMRLQAAAGAPLSGVVDDRTRRLLVNAGTILRNRRTQPDQPTNTDPQRRSAPPGRPRAPPPPAPPPGRA